MKELLEIALQKLAKPGQDFSASFYYDISNMQVRQHPHMIVFYFLDSLYYVVFKTGIKRMRRREYLSFEERRIILTHFFENLELFKRRCGKSNNRGQYYIVNDDEEHARAIDYQRRTA